MIKFFQRKNISAYKKLLCSGCNDSIPQLSVMWTGTAGLYITDSKTGILIDPYFSRQSLKKIFSGARLIQDEKLSEQWLSRLNSRIDAILVSHPHFDHVLDAPFIAEKTGTRIYGSENTVMIGSGAGVPEERLITITAGVPVKIGEFTVTFLESRHGTLFFKKIPYSGKIAEPLRQPAKASEYKIDAIFSIHIKHPSGTLLHHGSAGYLPGMYDNLKADVIFMGVAGRNNTTDYFNNTVIKTGADIAVPVHYDNFFKPLSGEIDFLYTAKFGEFINKAGLYRDLFRTRTVPIGKMISISDLYN